MITLKKEIEYPIVIYKICFLGKLFKLKITGQITTSLFQVNNTSLQKKRFDLPLNFI